MTKRVLKAALPLLVLALAVVAFAAMMATREPPARGANGAVQARLVHTEVAQRSPQRITVRATGSVVAADSVLLQPQISGRVVDVHPQLEPGAVIAAGEVLVEIEATDFEAALAEAEAQLEQARAELALEQGRREVARAEFDQFGEGLDVTVNESLALRAPQLESAKANVRRAEAQLQRAQANLERTTLRAPYRALVVDPAVDRGAVVGPQSQLARLVAVDRYWVRATLPVAHLAHVAIPGFNAEKGAQVRIRQAEGEDEASARHGEVLRLLGNVTPQGRLAQLLVAVPDPLALGSASGAAPLLLDAFVDVTMEGREARPLIRLPRAYLRGNDQVWVFDNGQLDIRAVEVVWRAEDHVLIDEGLRDGEHVVTSPLSNPVAGLRLRRAEDDDA
ncbi:efflux RND transporter periplasmic adaptor subunit [Algiphilus sp.]|uniref:efflux RND transporter periplasmic adaptor subunit n=1 Tax=Algiphilus sp. TaxID=1872431 RepID=UPI001CA6F003|nr:efflux RND transporter periplasmic adaptor subunit [Algiphilus acroporae]MCR9092296.1 efflux RND transporter periplasmic adaptor subunit [Pseudomonadota bacterium]